MKITIGKSGDKNISIDIPTLMGGRLLIQADSGGGKSYLLRRLAEQLFGKVQTILVDPEGEFATLREKFGFVLVGKGGETPADPRSATLVAHRLLELRASAICDIYEMKHQQRHAWVRAFLEAMTDIPKTLWGRQVIVIVDEAHMFCPERGKGESEAYGAMVDLCTRGRKRGHCAVFATQRLGQLSKDASSQLQNRLIGPTFEDINRKRAAEVLGVPKSDERKFYGEIQLLEPGNFFALGRAISRERILVKVGPVETTHPEAGSARHAAEPPPTPKEIAKLLPKLSDLPKDAEERAKTIGDLKSEIRSLKAQLRTQPGGKPVEVKVTDQKALDRAVKHVELEAQKHIRAREVTIKTLHDRLKFISRQAAEAAGINAPPIHKSAVPTSMAPLYAASTAKQIIERSEGIAPRKPLPKLTEHSAENNGTGELSGPERKILRALVELGAIGKDVAPKSMVAAWSGYSPIGGAFGNPLGALRTRGYVDYPQPGVVRLTEEGRSAAGDYGAPDPAEVMQRIESICTGPERKILKAVLERGGEEIAKDELAAASGYSPIGGAFGNPLGALRTKGLIEYTRPGVVRPADWVLVA